MLSNKQRLYWALQVGGWAFYVIVQVVTTILASGGQRISSQRLIFLIAEGVLCLILTSVLRYSINKWKWLPMGLMLLIPRVVLGVFVLGLFMYFVRIPISISLNLFNPDSAFLPEKIVTGILYYALIFFLWSVMYFIYNYFESYNKSLKLEASVKEIELNNLKSQLNPHFIFNALNSIRALVDENPSKAKLAINQLSSILRNSLVKEKRGLTPFDDELKIVKDYLGLESIRFEERLKTEFEITPESKEFMVPPLMIQTLVENGIKHGISKLTEGGLIHMKTEVENNYLKIQIRNSGQYVNGTKRHGGGLGIENTIQRLKLIYGYEASFRILTEKNGVVLTEIVIPHLHAL